MDTRWGGARIVGARTDCLEVFGAYEQGIARVSQYRRRKAESYRFAKDRRLSLLAGLLLDELLRERGLAERDMRYGENEHGKPLFADFPDLSFSLAHSGKMALAALSPHPIGVDVECLEGFPYDVADPFRWTAMESVGKVLGSGVGSYVDAGVFNVPEGFLVEHFEVDGYLICLAQRVASMEMDAGEAALWEGCEHGADEWIQIGGPCEYHQDDRRPEGDVCYRRLA